MLELSGVKSGELIPAKHFTHLATWLQARQTLSLQHAPTLQSLQAALKQPLEADELVSLKEYAQQNGQIHPQTVLTTAQVQDPESDLPAPRRTRSGIKRSTPHSADLQSVCAGYRHAALVHRASRTAVHRPAGRVTDFLAGRLAPAKRQQRHRYSQHRRNRTGKKHGWIATGRGKQPCQRASDRVRDILKCGVASQRRPANL